MSMSVQTLGHATLTRNHCGYLLYLARLLAPQPAPLLLLPSALLRSQLRLQLLELEQGLQHLSWYADTTTGSTGRWCSRSRRRRWSSS